MFAWRRCSCCVRDTGSFVRFTGSSDDPPSDHTSSGSSMRCLHHHRHGDQKRHRFEGYRHSSASLPSLFQAVPDLWTSRQSSYRPLFFRRPHRVHNPHGGATVWTVGDQRFFAGRSCCLFAHMIRPSTDRLPDFHCFLAIPCISIIALPYALPTATLPKQFSPHSLALAL